MLLRLRAELSAFANWWVQELREAGEAALARVAPQLVTHTLIQLEPQGGSVWIIRGTHRECVCRFAPERSGAWPRKLGPPDVVSTVRGTKVVLGLAPQNVLTQKLTMPAAVERELEQVVALQLERDCPVPLDQVYVDSRAGRRVREGTKLSVTVLIVQRDRVDRLRELVRVWGLRVSRIGMIADSGDVIGNFLRKPATRGMLQFTRTDRRLAVAAIALVTACAAVIAFQWGYERVIVGRHLRALQAPAAAAERLARELKADAAAAEGLVGLMRQPDALDVLTALTEVTPKDTWFYDLDISAQWPQVPRMKLSGFTPVATLLVGALQSSGSLHEVRLVSAASAGLGSGQDRLQLTAQLTSGAQDARAGAGSASIPIGGRQTP